jgi:hypothetical protein
MLKLIIPLFIVLLALAQQGLSLPEANTPQVTGSPALDIDSPPSPLRPWVSFSPDGPDNGPAIFQAHDNNHPDIRRRQGSASITTPAYGTTTEAYEAPPSLAPARSDLAESLSSLDSSLNSQVSSVIQEMTTGQCIGVPDVNGTPVTWCGPTAASASPTPSSSENKAAAGARGLGGGIAWGIAGALLL